MTRVRFTVGPAVPGAITTLGIIFVVLKATGVIAWSWWLVLLPFYGGLILAVILGLAAILTVVLAMSPPKRKGR